MEALRALVEDSTLTFDGSDSLELVTMDGNKRVVVGHWFLSDVVDSMIEAMGSHEEADDMLDLARHFAQLSKHIRVIVNDFNQPRGTEP